MRIQKVLYLFKCHYFKQIVEGFASLGHYTPRALTQGKYCAAPAWKTWTESCYTTQFLRMKKNIKNIEQILIIFLETCIKRINLKCYWRE